MAGELRVAATLLAAGAAVDLPSPSHATALMLAASAARPAMVALLLRGGAAPRARDANRWSALHHAAYAGCAESAALLLPALSHGDAAAQDRWARTPLCYACFGGHVAAAAALLRGGAPPSGGKRPRAAQLERFRNEWSTPLHLAVQAAAPPREGQAAPRATAEVAAELVRRLLEAGADVRRLDQRGRTPLQEAEAAGCEAAASLLREAEQRAAPPPQAQGGGGAAKPAAARASDPLGEAAKPARVRVPPGSGSIGAAWTWPPG